MRKLITALLAALLGSTTAAWAIPVHGEGLGGRAEFRTYCEACHGRRADGHGPRAREQQPAPADLRRLDRRFGMPLPIGTLASRVDPAPGHLATGPTCNDTLRAAFHAEMRFGATVRRGTLLAIFRYLEDLQGGAGAAAEGPR